MRDTNIKEDILLKLKNYFEKREDVIMAFLFGSYIKGTFRKDSDVDIAIYLKDYDINKVKEIWNELEDLLKKDIDLVILNISKPLICWEALKGEKILIKDHDFYIDYLLKISKEAMDLQELILDIFEMRKGLKR